MRISLYSVKVIVAMATETRDASKAQINFICVYLLFVFIVLPPSSKSVSSFCEPVDFLVSYELKNIKYSLGFTQLFSWVQTHLKPLTKVKLVNPTNADTLLSQSPSAIWKYHILPGITKIKEYQA